MLTKICMTFLVAIKKCFFKGVSCKIIPTIDHIFNVSMWSMDYYFRNYQVESWGYDANVSLFFASFRMYSQLTNRISEKIDRFDSLSTCSVISTSTPLNGESRSRFFSKIEKHARRLSVPISHVGRNSARRLSQLTSAIGEAFDQQLRLSMFL